MQWTSTFPSEVRTATFLHCQDRGTASFQSSTALSYQVVPTACFPILFLSSLASVGGTGVEHKQVFYFQASGLAELSVAQVKCHTQRALLLVLVSGFSLQEGGHISDRLYMGYHDGQSSRHCMSLLFSFPSQIVTKPETISQSLLTASYPVQGMGSTDCTHGI